ncbi:adenylate/guanylate cyclase domain-containing protein [Pedobacter miscanthi]|uniref:adenylate/guanylate cyclase domain-containing protein n=1 Tax=Pedobacter miscanthi TaxID=2259170 RepID=UPI00292D323E|nr:adenylate/guanylate cyclase domain-containing protein [Pedobacter miscanthi]
MKNNINTIPNLSTKQVSLQNLLDEDCSRQADGLLCQGNENPVNRNDNHREEKNLGILFLDIRNSTGLLQAGNESQAVDLLNKVLDLFSRVIVGFGGRVVDRTGDNLYAVFGLHSTISQAANVAFESANMLFELLVHVNKQYYNARFGKDLRIGIGIHAGRVIVDHGSGFSAMGLAVNLAARLQTETKNANNDLLLSDDFYKLLFPEKIQGHWELRENVQLKGIEQPQTIWLAGLPYLGLTDKSDEPDDLLFWLSVAG